MQLKATTATHNKFPKSEAATHNLEIGEAGGKKVKESKMSRAGEKYRIKGIPRGCRLGGLPALDNSFGRSATEIAARGLVLARDDKSSTGLIQDAFIVSTCALNTIIAVQT